jgi:hypothetical protein
MDAKNTKKSKKGKKPGVIVPFFFLQFLQLFAFLFPPPLLIDE